MGLSNGQIQELLGFIREHRSNEANFEKIKEKTEFILHAGEGESSLQTDLSEVQEKNAAAYTKALEQGGSAWPEFESYISALERTLTAAMNT